MCDEQGSMPNIFSQVKSLYSCSCTIKFAFTRATITFALERNTWNPKVFAYILSTSIVIYKMRMWILTLHESWLHSWWNFIMDYMLSGDSGSQDLFPIASNTKLQGQPHKVFGQGGNLTESLNKLSWKRSSRIIEVSSWPCTGSYPRVTPCPQEYLPKFGGFLSWLYLQLIKSNWRLELISGVLILIMSEVSFLSRRTGNLRCHWLVRWKLVGKDI